MQPNATILPDFVEGDVFYTWENGHFNLFKLLRVDTFQTVGGSADKVYHVRRYAPVKGLPSPVALDELTIAVGHTPIAATGFVDAKLLVHTSLRASDLTGFHVYLQLTAAPEDIQSLVIAYLEQGSVHAQAGRPEDEIDAYSRAIDLCPEFAEAYKLRGQCHMNLRQWSYAVDDFTRVDELVPDSLVAAYALGRCHLELHSYNIAIENFERALQIDPDHKPCLEHLNRARTLMKQSRS